MKKNYIENAELGQVMDREGQIGIKVDYELRRKANGRIWYTTEEELKQGRCGNLMKIWFRDGFMVSDYLDSFEAPIWDRHIVWTGQYAA